MKQVLLIILAIISFLPACKNPRQTTSISKKVTANPSELNGAWQLDYISGITTPFEGLYPNKKPQIIFDVANSRISGNTGCNNFSGPVSIDGSKISFSQPLTLTKMFCPGEGETVFLETLKKINLWAVTDTSTLNLIMGDVAMMRFRKVK
ncbi:MAG: META domain-containing protein [Chitinophagaceae bacterium]|nr:META domain-containing protein [Chitinophagaceae bacterium]